MIKALRQCILLISLGTFLAGCSTTEDVAGSGASLDNAYISAGNEQFFLGNLPQWINFSPWAKCERTQAVRYLNFNNLSKSYNLSYEKMLHLQAMWNQRIYSYRKSLGQNQLSLKDESFIFNNTYAKVLGGSYSFITPKFKNISVLWIDPFLKSKKKLKRIMSSDRFLTGYPVLLSHCLSSYEVDELVSKMDQEDLGVKVIGAEMFSVYNEKNKKQTFFGINLSKVLKKKNIQFFGPYNPVEVEGINKFKLTK